LEIPVISGAKYQLKLHEIGGKKMPKCQNCGQTWSWKHSFKKSSQLNSGAECPHCGVRQYITSRSRKKSGMLSFLIPVSFLSPVFFDISVALNVSAIIGLAIILIALYPAMIELTSENEPMW